MSYTAEAVRRGHPDKICDAIADAIMEAYQRRDSKARTAIEILAGHGHLYILGEVNSTAQLSPDEIAVIVRQTYEDIGYHDQFEIVSHLVQQSPEIAAGVDVGGAGDSGIVVGYACDETPEMLPKEIVLCRRVVDAFDGPYRNEFGPDGKVQVTIDTDKKVTHLVASIQHTTPLEDARHRIKKIILESIGADVRVDCQWYLNPAGSFTIGGFAADTGLTGRKIVSDAYGPRVPVGGGAFAGKDLTKVDRSGAALARQMAIDLVRSGRSHEATVYLAYAIGIKGPIWKQVVTNPLGPPEGIFYKTTIQHS